MNSSNFNAAAFLRALGTLPACRGAGLSAGGKQAEGPRPALLLGIAALSSAAQVCLPAAQAGLLGARLDRRYRRIRTVQDELGKLNFEKAKPGAALDDFVFEQTDFSMYKKISAEEFSLFNDGLDDFAGSFYVDSFRMNRKKIETVINSSYKHIGAFYYLNQEKHLYNPLLMAVMRTLHTSLAFMPLFTGEEVRTEFIGVVQYLTENKVVETKTFLPLIENFDTVYSGLLQSLDGSAVLHSDGMITTFAVEPENAAVSADGGQGLVLKGPVLKSTFHPRDKAYTMRLV
jgi:hypothetical protein